MRKERWLPRGCYELAAAIGGIASPTEASGCRGSRVSPAPTVCSIGPLTNWHAGTKLLLDYISENGASLLDSYEVRLNTPEQL